MKASYLTANQAWCVTLGDSVIGIGAHNRFIFGSRRELREELGRCGLVIGKGNKIITKGETNGKHDS